MWWQGQARISGNRGTLYASGPMDSKHDVIIRELSEGRVSINVERNCSIEAIFSCSQSRFFFLFFFYLNWCNYNETIMYREIVDARSNGGKFCRAVLCHVQILDHENSSASVHGISICWFSIFLRGRLMESRMFGKEEILVLWESQGEKPISERLRFHLNKPLIRRTICLWNDFSLVRNIRAF